MSGGDLYPPTNCCCRNYSFRNAGSYSGFYGGGSPKEFRFTSKMGTDVYDLASSLSAFFEDVCVALGIEVKAGDVLGKAVVVDILSQEPPMHGVNFDFAMGDDKPLSSG